MFSVSELLSSIKGLSSKLRVLNVLEGFLPNILEKSGVRNIEEVFEFIVESSYEMLPMPIRMAIKKDVYVSVVKTNKEKVIELVSALV